MKKLISLVLALMLVLSMAACGGAPDAPKGSLNTPTEPKDDNTASLGSMQGGVYTNEYAGLKLTLDDKWTFSTEEELKELDADDMEDGDMVTDMMAENLESLQSINLGYQKLTASERLAAMTTTEAELMEEMVASKDEFIASYAEAGITVSNMEAKTVTFLGKERTALLTTASIEGVPYYILQFMDYSKGAFGVIITLGAFMENTTEDMLALFEAI